MMEQFVSMGVPAHFSLCLYLCTMHLLLIRHLAMKHEIPALSKSRFIHVVNKGNLSEDGDGDFMRTSGPQARQQIKQKLIYSRSE